MEAEAVGGHFQKLLAVPQQIAGSEIGGDVGFENIDVILKLGGEIGQRQAFLDNRFKEILLRLDTHYIAVVAAVVILTPAHDLNGVAAGKILLAGIEMNVKILRGVVIVHVIRHVEINSAHGIDEGYEALDINHDIAVDREPGDIRDGVDKSVYPAAVCVYAVDLLALVYYVGAGVARYADYIDGFFIGVDHADHKSVGIGKALLHADEQESPYPLPPCLDSALYVGLVALFFIVAERGLFGNLFGSVGRQRLVGISRLLYGRRLHKRSVAHHGAYQKRRQNGADNDPSSFFAALILEYHLLDLFVFFGSMVFLFGVFSVCVFDRLKNAGEILAVLVGRLLGLFEIVVNELVELFFEINAFARGVELSFNQFVPFSAA